MIRRYVIYQRVSTEEQSEKGYSLEAMLDKCKHYIEAQENAELVKVYEDRGYSGTLPPAKRPALNQLLADLQSKACEFDTVLLWKLDRLSRNMRNTLNIEFLLRKTNKTLESVTERIDTASASGRMFFNTIASFAEFESAQIGERTKNAMSSKVGQIHLGGIAPLGYKLVNGKLEVDERDSGTVQLIYKVYAKVKNFHRTARYLNKKEIFTRNNKPWSHKQVQRILMNPVYAGISAWGRRQGKLGRANDRNKWIVKASTHVPLVPETLFSRVQEALFRVS